MAIVLLAGCAGGEGRNTPSSTQAARSQSAQKMPWPPPSAADLVGTWDQEGQKVVARFKPSGDFAIDNSGDLEHPFADGTYELVGDALTFTSDPTGSCKGSVFVWEVGLDESGSEDRLRVLVTRGACGAIAGEQWTFARID